MKTFSLSAKRATVFSQPGVCNNCAARNLLDVHSTSLNSLPHLPASPRNGNACNRLAESLELSWETDAGISVDLTGKYPCLIIAAEAEKGFRDRRLPITPDFAALLAETPIEEQTGKVFRAADQFGLDRVSRIISKIGEKANVVVNKEQSKFASSHDLRRAFGTRWATRVTPTVLQQLMRHSSIETTLKYYVEQDAETLGFELWKFREDKSVPTTAR